MKIKSINQDINISGTSLQGYFTATYNEVVAKFGKPDQGCDGKTTVEWFIKFEDGTVATIYDWKSESPMHYPDEPYEWHIGGFKSKAKEYIQALMAE